MILKKYKIGPVGDLKAVYKRTKLQGTRTPTQDEICALCGVGPERCETLIVYSSDNVYVKKLNYHNLCHGVVKKSVSKNNIIYIPWKIW